MHMKVFVDTNVMVDLLVRREPFYADTARLFSLVDVGKSVAAVAAVSFSTTAFLLPRSFVTSKTLCSITLRCSRAVMPLLRAT